MVAMSIYQVRRKAERFGIAFRVCDAKDVNVGSCDQFLTELSLRDCSVYTQRAYAIGLAHFFSWLHQSGGDPARVTRQTVGSYIAEFAHGARQGAIGVRSSQKPRQPRTINHRLSVLASYFEYCIRCDTEDGRGPWNGRVNPASGNPLTEELRHGMAGRDLPLRKRQRDGFRRRIPRTLPKHLEPGAIQKLIDTAVSYRDKAILTLLCRTGQRIGDWSAVAGRHGILGMALEDVDRKRRFITVRLKGARDQHRVPVTDDFWPIYEQYLSTERQTTADVNAVWIASRKGQGKPLHYASFESALRYIGRRAGIAVHPHLFRHTLAQGVLETTGNIKVAQEILGHSHLSTTADLYMRVDQHAMVNALVAAKVNGERATTKKRRSSSAAVKYVFAYDALTIDELERTIAASSSAPAAVEESGAESRPRKAAARTGRGEPAGRGS
jgi:site-specific recombinase XerD